MRAIAVSPLDAGLLDAVLRLVRLVESPADARVLGPLATREIIYRLLLGAQGARLRRDFDQPLRVEQLARELGMSVSGFHHHFKAVTALSPVQFHTRLRLQEARRLLLGADLDAAGAGYRVGYRDAAHVNRAYKSFFGVPPMRDMQRLRPAACEPRASRPPRRRAHGRFAHRCRRRSGSRAAHRRRPDRPRPGLTAIPMRANVEQVF